MFHFVDVKLGLHGEKVKNKTCKLWSVVGCVNKLWFSLMFKIFSEIKKMVSYFCEEKTFISIWFKKCEMWRTLNHKMVGIGLLPCLCSMVWSVVPVITKIHRIKHTIYIRPLSSVNCGSFCMKFILHEPYDLSWPLSGRSLG